MSVRSTFCISEQAAPKPLPLASKYSSASSAIRSHQLQVFRQYFIEKHKHFLQSLAKSAEDKDHDIDDVS